MKAALLVGCAFFAAVAVGCGGADGAHDPAERTGAVTDAMGSVIDASAGDGGDAADSIPGPRDDSALPRDAGDRAVDDGGAMPLDDGRVDVDDAVTSDEGNSDLSDGVTTEDARVDTTDGASDAEASTSDLTPSDADDGEAGVDGAAPDDVGDASEGEVGDATDAGLPADGNDGDASSGGSADHHQDAASTGPCMPAADMAEGTTDPWTDPLGTATVRFLRETDGRRSWRLATTAPLRDGLPANPRDITEPPDGPRLDSGDAWLDALYALALVEAGEASVDAISDAAFDNGAPRECPPGGCFETGRLWPWVWTRDIAYATWLGLAQLDPDRAAASLEVKLSAPRGGGPPEIVQDTGTGGSWPVSTDRVTWALGAATVMPWLDEGPRARFERLAKEALVTTLARDRAVAFDPVDGLYRGETSFLDWREQTYPDAVATDLGPIAEGKALGTNVAHLAALELAARLHDGEEESRYQAEADALRAALAARFAHHATGVLPSFTHAPFDGAVTAQADLLGNALAILFEVVGGARARDILGSYPHLLAAGAGSPRPLMGPPVIWPQQQGVPIYHNRAIWPFVTAAWLRAARHAGHPAAGAAAIASILRGAALHLSHMENLEMATGGVWREEGPTSGPVVNSHRQLWSVAAMITVVHQALFGIEAAADGLRVAPWIPAETARARFGPGALLHLRDLRWRGRTLHVSLQLPPELPADGALVVDHAVLDGAPLVDATRAIMPRPEGSCLQITLASVASPVGATITTVTDDDWRDVFAPRAPRVAPPTPAVGGLRIDLDGRGADPAHVVFDILRDGEVVATGLGTSSWTDTGVDPDAAASPCYAARARFVGSGLTSHDAPPMCWWGRTGERVHVIAADEFTHHDGSLRDTNGRPHIGDWGDPGHALEAAFTPSHSGHHQLQVVFANGAGRFASGITAGVKRLVVSDPTTGAEIAARWLALPHTGAWDEWRDSAPLDVQLNAGEAVVVRLETGAEVANMSRLEHYVGYTGAGGASPFARVDVAAIKRLYRGP